MIRFMDAGDAEFGSNSASQCKADDCRWSLDRDCVGFIFSWKFNDIVIFSYKLKIPGGVQSETIIRVWIRKIHNETKSSGK